MKKLIMVGIACSLLHLSCVSSMHSGVMNGSIIRLQGSSVSFSSQPSMAGRGREVQESPRDRFIRGLKEADFRVVQAALQDDLSLISLKDNNGAPVLHCIVESYSNARNEQRKKLAVIFRYLLDQGADVDALHAIHNSTLAQWITWHNNVLPGGDVYKGKCGDLLKILDEHNKGQDVFDSSYIPGEVSIAGLQRVDVGLIDSSATGSVDVDLYTMRSAVLGVSADRAVAGVEDQHVNEDEPLVGINQVRFVHQDPRNVSVDGQLPWDELERALKKQNSGEIERLISEHPLLLTGKDAQGRTALHRACEVAQKKKMAGIQGFNYLMKRGAVYDVPDATHKTVEQIIISDPASVIPFTLFNEKKRERTVQLQQPTSKMGILTARNWALVSAVSMVGGIWLYFLLREKPSQYDALFGDTKNK